MLLRDHVTKVDADTELDPLLRRDLGVSLGHPPLHLDRTPHRVHHAGEFRQEAVAGVLYDPAPMLRDLRIDQLSEVSFELLVRALLIRAHQPRVTGNISGKDRGETAGLAHSASPAANRRPDTKSSRCSGIRYCIAFGTTTDVIPRRRCTISRASSSRPI